MWHDIQYGFRQMRRSRLFSLTAVLLLSIGIGANTLIFSFIDALLLKRLPVRNPENLFLLEKIRVRQVRPDPSFFYQQFERLAHEQILFSAAVAEQDWSDLSFQPFSDRESVRLITTQMVSPNYFEELGVRAVAGRVLTREDTGASTDIPVVLSYQFWQSQFQKSPAVIGRKIRIRTYPFLVVGVLPQQFHSIDVERAPDVRFPISAARVLTGSALTEPSGERAITFQILVRLAPAVSAGRAAGAVLPTLVAMEDTLWRSWYGRASSQTNGPHSSPRESLEEILQYEREYHLVLDPAAHGFSRLRDQFSRAAILLMGAVSLLMFAICANLAGLLLARSEERKREIAVRLSIGANQWRLLRQLLIENVLLAFPGSVLGVALAYGLAPWLARLLPAARGLVQYAATPQILSVQPDLSVLLFAVAVSVVSVLLFGTAPAWRITNLDLNRELKRSSRSAAGPAPGTAIIAVQVALAVVLLAAASIMFRTFWNLEHLNPGFDRAHVVEFTVDPQNASDSQRASFYRQLREQVAILPGVRSASYASMGIMRGIGTKTTVAPQGRVLPQKTFLNTSTNSVTSGYFKTLGIPLLRGRDLEIGDLDKKPAHIVINRAFADFFFPHENEVGKAVVQGVDGTKPPTAVIVGLVGTAKYRSFRELDPPTYYSVSDDARAGTFLYVRTFGDPAQTIAAVRGVLRRLDPTVPLIEAFTLEQEVQSSLWQERMVAILSGFFGVVALLLSALGLYGTLAYSVARRSRELAIRIAVGAQVRDIVHTVCSRILCPSSLDSLLGYSLRCCCLVSPEVWCSESVRSIRFPLPPRRACCCSQARVLPLLPAGALPQQIRWRRSGRNEPR